VNRRIVSITLAVVALTILLAILLFVFFDDYKTLLKNKKKQQKEVIQYRKNKPTKNRKAWIVISDIAVFALLTGLIAWKAVAAARHELISIDDHTARITIVSGSMSYKYDQNTYLDENGLDNQIPLYSLIELEKLDESDEIALYDVCAYQNNKGDYIVHRIVGVVEKDDGPYYRFKGDANENSDFYLVKRAEVLYRWTGKQNVVLGRTISFVRSEIGIIVLLYILALMIVAEVLNDRKKKFFESLPPPPPPPLPRLPDAAIISFVAEKGKGQRMYVYGERPHPVVQETKKRRKKRR